MYSRNYLSTDNYPILPPGYSGVALQRYAQGSPEGSVSDGADALARRPVFEDASDFSDNSDMAADEQGSHPVNENGSRGSERNEEKESHENKKIPAIIPDEQKIGKSSHDDILIAGIIMLLLSEGKCDELTLFLLGFLLL